MICISSFSFKKMTVCAHANTCSCMLMKHESHIRNLEYFGHSFIYIHKIYVQIYINCLLCASLPDAVLISWDRSMHKM